MCQCDPLKRTPFCGVGDCQMPEQKDNNPVRYRSRQITKATQFIYKTKKEEERIARKLGLSQNMGVDGKSVLWEKNFTNLGWKIVYFGDYIIHKNRDIPCNKQEFEERFELL